MKKGFTLIEILVVCAILVLVGGAVAKFATDIIGLNRTIYDSLIAADEGRAAIKTIEADLREAISSNTGSFPIDEASGSAITFYSDINSTPEKEQVRYYASGTSLMRRSVTPTGNPLSYAITATNTKYTTLVHSLTFTATTTPMFQYFDSTYNGTSSSSPLTQPVMPSQIRLVKILFVVDSNPYRSPQALYFTTQVQLRNLKDNL